MEDRKEAARLKKNERQKAYDQRTNLAAQKKYRKDNTKQIAFLLNYNTDADIFEQLEKVPSKNGYIKECIRRCMELDAQK